MDRLSISGARLTVAIEQWPLISPFHIAGFTWNQLDVVVVQLESEGAVGKGEAAGVYYHHDVPRSMSRQIEAVRTAIESRIDRESLYLLLSPGGARNAVDCALWDLEAKLRRVAVWRLAGLSEPAPIITTFTCGADLPERMAAAASGYTDARAIKLKLVGDELDAERVCAVRHARPEVWLSVDANQSFSRAHLERMLPLFVETRVALIEQPFPVGKENWLEGIQSPVAIAADESVQTSADLASIEGLFQAVNIKLDKCGGLTEGLAMARSARSMGLDVMVGNMIGTSLAMAPACLLGQLCSIVDLDGPIFLAKDREPSVRYVEGSIVCPAKSWGDS